MSKVETLTKEETLAEWPPVVHWTRDLPPRPGSIALCGKKLMGVAMDDGHVTCAKCAELHRILP